MNAKPLVIALGNPFRNDDAIGFMVADQLESKGAVVVKRGDDLTALLDDFKKSDKILIVDALMSSGRPVGEAIYFDASEDSPEESEMQTSTHALSLFKTIDLARALGSLPTKLYVYGIVGKSFQMGQELSQDLTESLPAHVHSILAKLSEWEAQDA